ncbi:MAG: DinB family protein [Thermaceae bacterium]|nr:DinB family protein [Thermaceae bacterium]
MNPYVSRILGRLGPRDPLAVLQDTPRRLEALAPALYARAEQSYGPGKWTARQILCHLADTELGLGFRLRQIAAGVETIQAFDQEAWAQRYSGLSLELALRSFLALRSWNLAWLQGLDRAVWGRSYHHPERGLESFELAVRLWAGHDLNHLEQLEQITAHPSA